MGQKLNCMAYHEKKKKKKEGGPSAQLNQLNLQLFMKYTEVLF